MSQTPQGRRNQDPAQQLRDARDALDEMEAVDYTLIHTDRRPPRLEFKLASHTGGEIPEGVHDVIDEFHLTIETAAYAKGGSSPGLVLTTVAEPVFEYVNTFAIRRHGNSLVVTLPHDGLAKAGLGKGDDLDIFVRPGEFSIRSASE